MVIIETKIFSRQINTLLGKEEYRMFQLYLLDNWESGERIKGSGGIRKIRWNKDHKGKSGGIRILYYVVIDTDNVLLLLAYSKSEKDDLSAEQLKILKKIVREELDNGR